MDYLFNNVFLNKRVLITGHTGFKGSWLAIWLRKLGACVIGYSLHPLTSRDNFVVTGLKDKIMDIRGDIRDIGKMNKAFETWQPEIVFHLAAQPIVGLSYKNPRETFETNIMGTVNLMECIKKSAAVKAAVIVTSDKCYDNKEWLWSYRENDSLGGFDPYSSSKACCELVISAYLNSFFRAKYTGIASVRAGNVIGGGDWSPGRIIPDCIRALLNNEKIAVRNPNAVRPWQHVLEPLSGYLALAERLIESPAAYSEAWNFGPDENGAITVEQLVKRLYDKWKPKGSYFISEENHPHEANMLKLDCSKAKSRLCWAPKWDIEKSLDKVIEWNRSLQEGKDMYEVCAKQIDEYALT